MTTVRKTENSSNRYVPLSSVKVHTKVDVYGVVKFFKQPYKSRGSDYCAMVSLVDPSYMDPMDKLKCLLFAKEMSKLPLVKLGQIIRFHRLSISEFAGSLQGQNSPGFSWLLFSGDVGDPVEPVNSSSSSYSITDTDREKVKELRHWASNKDELHEKLCSFNEVAVGGFFDLVCQVVQTSVIEPDVGRLLKVWDGTQCIYDVRNVSADCEEQAVQKDEKLLQDAKGFLYDVCVFDDHFRTSRNIKPGDYVKFINLHAAEYKSASSRDGDHTVVEFVLHRGDSFGRSVKVLPQNNVDLNTMKQRQDIVAMENGNFNSCESQAESAECKGVQVIQGPSTSGVSENTGRENGEKAARQNERSEIIVESSEELESDKLETVKRHATDSGDKRSVKELKKECDRQLPGETSGSCISSNEPRCMAQSSTVILNHPHTKRRKIKEVLDHAVPNKFRVRAKVYDYHPKTGTVKTFLKLHCSVCHYLCSYPAASADVSTDVSRSDSQLQIGSTFKGVPHYNCPQCLQNQDSLNGNTVQLFQEIEPEDLLKDESSFVQIKDFLTQLCPLDLTVEERPWIECCLQSYSVTQGTGYQIFDTVVV
ncbi:protection of telomeres protein 1-like [Mercenaria mercenaria]|uniref:protection of telomeres protein 1-like n=1 Tax=Mercenaria mercenaria TaxID=6596 RepID=UPI00234EC65A|nr:protection of telomeres protein 1-like [Mercenaria mercenaria]